MTWEKWQLILLFVTKKLSFRVENASDSLIFLQKFSIYDEFAFLPQNDRKWEKWQKSIVILWFCAQWDLLWHRIQPGKLIISEFPFTYVHPHRSPPDYVVWLNRVVMVRLWIELERQKMVRCLWWPCRPSEVSHYWLLWTPIRLIEFNFIVLHLI